MTFGHKGRTNPIQRELDEELEGLRDDCIALFKNSGLTQQQIHERGGPTPKTISNWIYGITLFPRMSTIQAFTTALGYRLSIVEARSANVHKLKTGGKKKHG